jgi:acyl dehydratase
MTTGTALRLPPGILGVVTIPITDTVDARWLMAYTAGLGDTAERCYDTLAAGGPLAHPLFPVCYEWPALVALRQHVTGDDLARLSVHATHDLVIERLPRDGDRVTTTARMVAVERRRTGTLVVARLTTVDADGRVLTTTDYGSVYRGVDTPETGRIADPLPRPAVRAGNLLWSERVELPAGIAHVYTECARIWNPIHTDAAVARAAGLPGIILHGTATLALAVSRVVTRELGGDVARVRGVAARFTGFVRLPSAITVRGRGRQATTIAFDAVDADGTSVLGEGVLST